ncbi:hypothetical protein ABC733_00605 [Mangrovibacter sp. SLW1]
MQGDGSTGLVVTGSGAHFSNQGDMHIFGNGLGMALEGDGFNVNLGGSITVDAGELREAADGVKITGHNGTLVVSGNLNLTDVAMTQAGTRPDQTGLAVQGDNNQVTISGAVNLSYQGLASTQPHVSTTQTGVQVSGSGNHILINGGLNVDYRAEDGGGSSASRQHNLYGLQVTGTGNTVTLSGESSYLHDGAAPYNRTMHYVYMNGAGNRLILDKDFAFTYTSANKTYANAYSTPLNVFFLNNGAQMDNHGELAFEQGFTRGVYLGGGSSLYNNGTLRFRPDKGNEEYHYSSLVLIDSSLMHNDADGLLDIVSVRDSRSSGASSSEWTIFINKWTGLYGVGVLNSTFINDGTVQVSGQGPTVWRWGITAWPSITG